MTPSEQLDTLEQLIGHAMSIEALIMIAREIVAVAREIQLQHINGDARFLETQLELRKLRALLREALRGWVQRTPDVEDAVIVWQIAKEAGLQ